MPKQRDGRSEPHCFNIPPGTLNISRPKNAHLDAWMCETGAGALRCSTANPACKLFLLSLFSFRGEEPEPTRRLPARDPGRGLSQNWKPRHFPRCEAGPPDASKPRPPREPPPNSSSAFATRAPHQGVLTDGHAKAAQVDRFLRRSHIGSSVTAEYESHRHARFQWGHSQVVIRGKTPIFALSQIFSVPK